MQTTRRVTLTDVATRAGVSTTTASYILNGRSVQMRIAPETERRVREAVEALGYRPNRSARTLRTANTATIGLISDFLAGGHVSSQMLLGAGAAAREADHLLMIGETDGDVEVEGAYIDELLDRQVDGIIYATRTASLVRVPESLRTRRTVLLNCRDVGIGLPSVIADEAGGGEIAAQLLLDRGIDDGIYVVGEDPTREAFAGPERLQGIHPALSRAGRALAGIVSCEWAVRPAHAAVSRWLDGGARPRALICLNDRVAMGAYQAVGEAGLVIPDDVAVVSFDGSELATWLRPPVVSVALPFHELGATAVRLLVAPPPVPTGIIRIPMTVQPGGGSLPWTPVDKVHPHR